MGKFQQGVIIHNAKMSCQQSPSSPKPPHKFLQTLKNSPSLLRKKFMHSDSDLSSDWTSANERCFHVHYGGRIPVRSLRVCDAVTAAEKVGLMTNAHQSNAQQVTASCTLRVDKSTITFDDSSRDVLESLPLFCIAYCATDVRHPKSIALTCKTRGSVHCHVFESTTREKATEIVSYIQKAFEDAWVDWKQTHPGGEDPREKQTRLSPPSHVPL